jgi:hypothetical protein
MIFLRWPQFGIWYLVLLGAAVLPLSLITYPPLDDYPNHLARMQILAQGANDPHLSAFYQVDWKVVPNLAMDLMVPWLAQIMPLEHASRLFVGLVFVLITTGTVALYAALHRELSWWPLLAFLFLYSRVLLFGFINYLAGVGLFLWTLAAWIHWRERPVLFRLAVFSLLSTGLFFAHLYALGLYAVSIAGLELSEFGRRAGAARRLMRRLPVAAGQFAVPVLLFLFKSPTAGDVQAFSYFDLAFHFWHKIRAAHQVLLSYHVWFDRLTFVALGAALIAALALRWVEFDRRMLLPLALLVLVFLALPQGLMGGLLVDFRLPAALVFVLIASLRPRSPGIPFARAVALALLALAVIRMGLIAERWYGFDQVYDGFVEAVAELPLGSRIVTASARRPDAYEALAPPLLYLGAIAVVQRSAFEPTVFTIPGQQPIVARGESRQLTTCYPWQWPAAPLEELLPKTGERPDDGTGRRCADDLLPQYDYLLLLYPKDSSNPLPGRIHQLHVDRRFHLYRIVKAEGSGRAPERSS